MRPISAYSSRPVPASEREDQPRTRREVNLMRRAAARAYVRGGSSTSYAYAQATSDYPYPTKPREVSAGNAVYFVTGGTLYVRTPSGKTLPCSLSLADFAAVASLAARPTEEVSE